MHLDATTGCRFTDADGKSFRVYFNGAHVCISEMDRQVVFAREEPGEQGWYDEKHRALVKAAEAFEKALRNAIKTENHQ